MAIARSRTVRNRRTNRGLEQEERRDYYRCHALKALVHAKADELLSRRHTRRTARLRRRIASVSKDMGDLMV